MFGYIMVNKGELKFKEYELYQSYYCGLCRKLKEHYGILGQLTLSYDLTFVILLLTALYEPKGRKGSSHCAVHPLRKQVIRVNEFTDYAADMNMLLTYYKCEDDCRMRENGTGCCSDRFSGSVSRRKGSPGDEGEEDRGVSQELSIKERRKTTTWMRWLGSLARSWRRSWQPGKMSGRMNCIP